MYFVPPDSIALSSHVTSTLYQHPLILILFHECSELVTRTVSISRALHISSNVFAYPIQTVDFFTRREYMDCVYEVCSYFFNSDELSPLLRIRSPNSLSYVVVLQILSWIYFSCATTSSPAADASSDHVSISPAIFSVAAYLFFPLAKSLYASSPTELTLLFFVE